MKKEDFKEATPKHIKIAKKIVKKGDCISIECVKCPLSSLNNLNTHVCNGTDNAVRDAKQFLELFDTEPKSLNFYERLSATIFKKQILFKQVDGTYYNQRLNENMTKSDVKEWLLAEVAEVCKENK